MVFIAETWGEIISEYPSRDAALAYIGEVQLQSPTVNAAGRTSEAIWRKDDDGGGRHVGYLLTTRDSR